MINARHSFGICQTPKISNFARLKWTLPPSTEIIHSHIWGPPLTRATYLKHTSMLDNKGRRSDGTFKVANRILVWPMWDSLQIQSPSNMGHRQIEHSTVILPETETKNYSRQLCDADADENLIKRDDYNDDNRDDDTVDDDAGWPSFWQMTSGRWGACPTLETLYFLL